jgi:hypothetical protein
MAKNLKQEVAKRLMLESASLAVLSMKPQRQQLELEKHWLMRELWTVFDPLLKGMEHGHVIYAYFQIVSRLK